MCGLAGFSFTDNCDLTSDQREKMLILASVGADLRGGQSYGWLTVGPDGNPTVKKGMGPLVGADFKTMAQAKLGYLHSRFATKGAITIENQHPFEYGDIVGAHNGVIYNSDYLDRVYGDKTVDSEHLFERISKGQGIASAEGYGILEWYDKRNPGQLKLCNIGNGEVTLFEIYDKSDLYLNGYFWTSKKTDGEWALRACGIENYEAFDLREGRVYIFTHGSEDLQYDPNLELKVGSYGVGRNFDPSLWQNDWAADDLLAEKDLSEHPSLGRQYELDPNSEDFMEQYEMYRQSQSGENEASLDSRDNNDYLDPETSLIKEAVK